MPQNDFLTYAAAPGANVVDQPTYLGAAWRGTGAVPGLADASQSNKPWRQASIISSVIAQFIAAKAGTDVIDDGTTATILANLGAAIVAGSLHKAPTRTVLTIANASPYAPPAGCTRLFVRMVGATGGGGGTIGSTHGGVNGGATTFNGVTASGGRGAQSNNTNGVVPGGTVAAAGAGAAALRIPGPPGASGAASSPTTTGGAGGMGGAGPLNIGGQGADSGNANVGGAGGGSAGEYVELIIALPPGSIAFAIGAAGGAGDGANAGTPGQPGLIAIDEFYD